VKQSRQFFSIGHELITGPRAIFPPSDNNGWLEKDISVYIHYFGDHRLQQISLWSDSTMNREENFLKPVIRFAHWERQNDMDKLKAGIPVMWPDVRIFLGYIKEELFNDLNDAIIDVQKHIPSLQFKPLGISLQRDVVDLNSDHSRNLEIWVRNGVQSISYYSPFIENDVFCKKVLDLKNIMLKSMHPFDHSGWKERYDKPFNNEIYDWDYKPVG
jgi:hypothetical protein